MLTGSVIGDIKYQFNHGGMVIKLILVNAGVFLFFGLLYLLEFLIQNNTAYGYLLSKIEMPAYVPALLQQPWSVFTYMFLHTGFFHVLFNMLWLYWFGEIFVLYLGEKKVLPLYLIGGIAGAAVYVLAYNFIPVFKPVIAGSMMLGASASIFAIVFAAATLRPDHEIRLLFFGIVKIKYIAIVSLLLDVIHIPYGNAGGYLAHVGGALSGYIFIKALQNGFDLSAPFIKIFDFIAGWLNRKATVKVAYRNEKKTTPKETRTPNEQQQVDDILDKIARSGYDSLTKQEKDFLFNYSQK